MPARASRPAATCWSRTTTVYGHKLGQAGLGDQPVRQRAGVRATTWCTTTGRGSRRHVPTRWRPTTACITTCRSAFWLGWHAGAGRQHGVLPTRSASRPASAATTTACRCSTTWCMPTQTTAYWSAAPMQPMVYSVVNNTVYQSVGDAILLEGDTVGTSIVEQRALERRGLCDSRHHEQSFRLGERRQPIPARRGPERSRRFLGWRWIAIRSSIGRRLTGQDANSLATAAGFVDVNGADNVLGFRAADAYDGGLDDNFYLRKNSPAIDRGNATLAPPTDREGFPRADDPGTDNFGDSIVDLGAYEFRGSSLDVTAPEFATIHPDLSAGGSIAGPVSEFTIQFSEPLNPIDAQAVRNYELIGRRRQRHLRRCWRPQPFARTQLRRSQQQRRVDGLGRPTGVRPLPAHSLCRRHDSRPGRPQAGRRPATAPKAGTWSASSPCKRTNHPPTFFSTPTSVPEHIAGYAIGQLVVVDPDVGDTHTFVLSDNRFEVVGSLLKLKLDQSLALDEAAQVDLAVTAIDSRQLAMDPPKHFVITVSSNPFPWHRSVNSRDVNDDGSVSASDALRIINQLNNPTIPDAKGKLPKARPANVRVFYDVKADGFISAIDALLVINELNRGDGGEGEFPVTDDVVDASSDPWRPDSHVATRSDADCFSGDTG